MQRPTAVIADDHAVVLERLVPLLDEEDFDVAPRLATGAFSWRRPGDFDPM